VQDYDDDEYERVMRVNVRGVWLNLKRAVTLMLQGDGGSVINMASGAALRGLPLLSGYVASKHAVLGLTRTAAVELGDSGVRVNAVCAGPVVTRMMDSLAERSPTTARPRSTRPTRTSCARSDGAVRGAGGDRRAGGVPGLGRVLLHDRGGDQHRRRRLRGLTCPSPSSTSTAAWRW
jgi:NAD(P)-dependent dehydrogenase (short-subunit alcohol dehydrogenase family)